MEASSEFFVGGYYGHTGGAEFEQKPFDNISSNNNNNNNFAVDDLLDLPKEDEIMTDAFFDSITGNSGESSLTVVDSCNSSVSGGDVGQFNGDISCRSFTDTQFSGSELCVPYDDLAELEWLSNFVEESFSSDDLHNLHLISPTTNSKPPSAVAAAATTDTSSSATNNSNSSPIFPGDVSVPGKARSKRSRAAPCKWASRLLLLASPTTSSSEANYGEHHCNNTPNNPLNVTIKLKAPKAAPSKKREAVESPGRKCLHCGSDKTPQWRTGPMGPKTLCNACGVRYKSGRLVPEYRPAASPTFVSAKHSNSHRKVLELRRQKEMQRQHQQQQQLLSQASMFGVSNGGDDFLIHHHHPHQQNVGPDYRLMI
ncbi:OLC1v1014858C1 [Oldenlandia corymbosa var. corymbosa]|uniref:GATA transcription factor n=1 Tax=Oldenlandia corymbosa var. corymbosa TaxID=529605 RepID=A0AAV1E420_OLDCO|nr:OLC1v1014858C1 [Oldenlandia corymbosa var. corymbosa]